MKNMKMWMFAVLAAVGMAGVAIAADEAPKAINFTQTLIGTKHESTGTARTGSIRRVDTDDIGQLRTNGGWREVISSTGSGTGGLLVQGNSSNTFIVTASSWVGAVGCRSVGDNCNVLRLASFTDPVYVARVYWGDDIGFTRIRLFDTQGSTSLVDEKFNQLQSSSVVQNVDVWFSSGVTFLKSGAGSVKVYLGRQNR